MSDSSDFPLELSSSWIDWIADNLLRGASRSEIRAELLKESVPEAMTNDAIESICSAPGFKVALQYAERALRSEMILRLQRERSKLFRIESHVKLGAVQFHGQYRATNCPVLLPDYASEWLALKKWSMEWLRDKFGQETIAYCDDRESDPDYDQNAAILSCETSIASLVDRIQATDSSNDFYAVARNRNLQSNLSALWTDVDPPEGYLQEVSDNNSAALWIGPTGTITPLHHDSSDILFTQVVGRKRIWLIAPNQLVVAEAANNLYGPSLEKVRKDPSVSIVELELGPGETLFIPLGWWHQIEALSPSISVSMNAMPDNDFSWYRPGSIGD